MGKEKEEILNFIDDSLFDKNKDKQLDSLLNSARNIIMRGY